MNEYRYTHFRRKTKYFTEYIIKILMQRLLLVDAHVYYVKHSSSISTTF